ncbi:zinc ABC transporter substrate-binding protein [Akkermansiaceae bacterium]|jgi:manganese/zinc/iron transport system substrate-binding protein|nr:zinc ABC transporter substrate-binding protein [bacterium]MDA7908079.1 zinc ABC transporter substrate-binding protein [Akkermansiaceae bacterium]MDA9830342.1 zinc ABC transporter substrate-binding protein [Akkermansiaceae bacterium]MDB4464880.1 zinc ABC transporter substrate-binding protein [Akkermansiaceae bacterium]MDF1714854.1 zinc ABC transporter substrate-binding protein [Akkermansiaceae bacterium]
MKRSLLLAPLLFLGACTNKDEAAKTDGTIVTTVGMIGDVTRQIAGDKQEVINIIGEGTDPHTYQPSKSEIDKIQKAGLVLYNGHFLEGKMGSILKSRAEQDNPVFAVAEGLDEVELIGDGDHPDPHLWMDLSIWSKVAGKIGDELAAFDPDNANQYQKQCQEYQEKLNALHTYALMVFPTIPQKQRVLVTAHDAFSYLGRAYGIEVRGIQGISTESEAGTKDINDLVSYLVENEIPAIFIESSVPEKSVKTVIEGAAEKGHTVKIGGKLFSDAMGPAGTYQGTYIGMMDHNITTIVNALGGSAPEGGFQNKLND